MALYAAPNLSIEARHHLGFILKAFSTFCDTLIFLLVGMAIVLYLHAVDPFLAVWSIGACLLGRCLNIFTLVALANAWRSEPIPIRFQCVMAHSGLRGAIAVALAVQMEGPFRETIVAATMVTVLFTVFVLGGTTKRMLDLLQIDVGVEVYQEDLSKLLPNWIEKWLIDPEVLATRRHKPKERSMAHSAQAFTTSRPCVSDPFPSVSIGRWLPYIEERSRIIKLARWLRLPSTQSKYSIV